jgi:hypothetical protein
MAPTFYAEKFRYNSLSVESLWQTLLHIITVLSGIRCMVCIGSNDVEAVKFGRRLVEFGLTWTQTPYSLLVWNLEDSKLSDTPGLVELDLEYDVDKDLSLQSPVKLHEKLCLVDIMEDASIQYDGRDKRSDDAAN